MTNQGFAIMSCVTACVLLFPMPLNGRGEILHAAATCYRRMWRTFFYMVGFYAARLLANNRPI